MSAAPPRVSDGRPAPPEGRTRLLALTGGRAARALADHRALYPVPPRPGRQRRPDIVETIRKSGLRGRGGGSFPLASKMASVAAAGGSPVVVVNGCEGEPASHKDEALLNLAPHLVLDGAVAAAAALGADRIVVAIERRNGPTRNSVTRALHERQAERTPIDLVEVPPRFVSGEESALVHHINGGPAKPTAIPPRPFQKGVDGLPTLVANAETFAHVPQILLWGADWFRAVGTHDEPGSMLTTLSGAVAQPGVYEVPIGMPLAEVIGLAGGAPFGVQAVIMGGYYGTWLSGHDVARASMCNKDLKGYASSVGCGAMVVLPHEVCGLDATARILQWLAGETAGQCGPCVHGLAALASATTALAQAQADASVVAQLDRWCSQIDGRGGCRFPDGAVRFLRSALSVFAPDVAAHAHGRHCGGASAQQYLRLPARPIKRDWR